MITNKTNARAYVLLEATLQILKKCNEGPFVQDVFEQTAEYDGTDCDGACLQEDITNLLEEAGIMETGE